MRLSGSGSTPSSTSEMSCQSWASSVGLVDCCCCCCCCVEVVMEGMAGLTPAGVDILRGIEMGQLKQFDWRKGRWIVRVLLMRRIC